MLTGIGEVRPNRAEDEDGLRPQPKGRPRHYPVSRVPAASELDQLRQENERLRAAVPYLGNLRA